MILCGDLSLCVSFFDRWHPYERAARLRIQVFGCLPYVITVVQKRLSVLLAVPSGRSMEESLRSRCRVAQLRIVSPLPPHRTRRVSPIRARLSQHRQVFVPQPLHVWRRPGMRAVRLRRPAHPAHQPARHFIHVFIREACHFSRSTASLILPHGALLNSNLSWPSRLSMFIQKLIRIAWRSDPHSYSHIKHLASSLVSLGIASIRSMIDARPPSLTNVITHVTVSGHTLS